MFSVIRMAISVSLFYLVFGHPGGDHDHHHGNKGATIVKLKNQIRTMEELLSKQERRLTVGFDFLKRKVNWMEKMAARAENEFNNKPTTHINCTIPLPPPHGRILGISYDTNGTPHLDTTGVLYFVCDDGFHLFGSESRTCLRNGTWSGDSVVCVDITFQIAACAKLNCQNGGTCSRHDENSYRCVCPDGFYGKRCQKVRRQSSRNGGVVQATCIERNNRERCSCPPGYRIGLDHILCFDKDECAEQFDSSTEIVVIPDNVGTKAKRDAYYNRPLCRHQCVNTPGSFYCTCPVGYNVDSEDTGECKDVDECRTGLHNCTENQHCFNIGGGFKCVQLSCPTHYFPATDFVCQHEKCEARNKACLKKPLTYAYRFIDLPSRLNYPADVFRLVADKESKSTSYRFAVLPGEQSNFFRSRKVDPVTGMLMLQRPLNGTDSATVDFEMKEIISRKKRRLTSKYVHRITFFQSFHDYR